MALLEGPRPRVAAAPEARGRVHSGRLGARQTFGSVLQRAPLEYDALAGPDVADLMRAARRILTEMLAGQAGLLDALREAQDATDNEPGASGNEPGASDDATGATDNEPGGPDRDLPAATARTGTPHAHARTSRA